MGFHLYAKCFYSFIIYTPSDKRGYSYTKSGQCSPKSSRNALRKSRSLCFSCSHGAKNINKPNHSIPVMISRTISPRSILLTSCRALVCNASTLSGLAHSRCSIAVVVKRANGVFWCCCANRRTVFTSARV